MLRRIAVFAGQADLVSPEEVSAALQVGRLLGENAVTLVFDSAATGMIETVADTAAQSGGRLLGIRLDGRPAGRADLAEDRVTASVGAWREEVGRLSDAFLGLPGGSPRWVMRSRCGVGAAAASIAPWGCSITAATTVRCSRKGPTPRSIVS